MLEETDWEAFAKAFEHAGHAAFEDKSQAPLWSPVSFAGNRRANAAAQEVFAAVLDFDHRTPDQLGALLDLIVARGTEAIVHTTHSHRLEEPRCRHPDETEHPAPLCDSPRAALVGGCCVRMIAPLVEPLMARAWPPIWRKLAQEWIAADEHCKDVARQYYVPSVSAARRADAWILRFRGAPISPTAIPFTPPTLVPAVNAMILSDQILTRIAKKWQRSAKNEQAELGERLLKIVGGEAFAAPGERDVIAWRLACGLVKEFPRIDSEAFAKRAELSLERMGPDAPRDLAGKIERARTAKTEDARDLVLYDPNREFECVQKTLDAISQHVLFYAFGGAIATVGGDKVNVVDVHTLRQRTTEIVNWILPTADGPKSIGMPQPVALAALASGPPESLPKIRGIARASFDGRKGYDPETGYVTIPRSNAAPATDPPEILAAELLSVVQDFEWADAVSPCCWIAALLTLFARPLIKGPIPLFAIDKNAPGTGGTLLAKLLGEIYLGEQPGTNDYCRDREEWRKTLFAAALGSKALLLLDNVTGRLGDDLLNQIVTSGVLEGRILGQSKMVAVPFEPLIVATGNNLEPRGDLLRRTFRARLETRSRAPEARTGFAHRDLLAWVREHRERLAACAMGMIVQRGPAPEETWGSFESWSSIVRAAIVRAGLDDPIQSRAGLAEIAADVSDAQIPDLLVATLIGLGATTEAGARSAEEIFRDGGRAGACWTAALSLLPEKSTARDVGKVLRANAGRVFLRGRITRGPLADGLRKWWIDASVS